MIKFFVFGLPHFERDGQSISFRRSKALALMAYLVAIRRPQSRDALAELLWPEFVLEAARANLRRELSILNKLFGDELLLADRSQVVFNEQAAIEVDLYTFWEMTRVLNSTALKLDTEAIVALENALQVYQADFLAGFSVHASAEFDDWLYFEAESIRRAFANALQTLISYFSQKQDYPKAIHYARQCLALDPLHEAAQRQLMSLLAWAGDYADALRQYQSFERLLQEELDVLPEPETVKLYEAIRSRQFAPQQAPTPKLSQLTHNLAPQVSAFVGREKELTEIQGLLQNRHSRLLTIVASGGMGKTRLALELAQSYLNMLQSSDTLDWELPEGKTLSGIYFIDLSPVFDAANIVQTTADTIACLIQADGRSPRQQVLDFLSDKSLLLIFDNYEHLLDDALFISEIYQSAPDLRILVTSREALNLQEETLFRIAGMEIPDTEIADDWHKFSAIELFINSARRVQANFVLAEHDKQAALAICHSVGAMPLGIILATAWLDTLTITELASEINRSLDFLSTEARNLAPRHRSIRAVFDPSWQRLTDAERDVFMQLSVFRAGFTLQAAQRIIGASLPQLSKLLKKSLIQRDMATGRYSMHEVLRQYAQEHLEASGKAESLRTAHSRYYLDWIASLEADIKGRRQLPVLEELELDIDNLRTAWHWAGRQRDYRSMNHALRSFFLFFDMRSRHHELSEILIHTISQLAETTNEEEIYIVDCIRTRVIKLELFNLFNNLAGIMTDLEHHLSLARKFNDKAEIAYTLGMQAWCHRSNDAPLDALRLMTEAISYHREAGDNYYLADTLIIIGVQELHNITEVNKPHQLEKIESYLQEAIRLHYQIGDGHGRIWALNAHVMLNHQIGRFEAAIQFVEEMQSLAILYQNRFALAQTYYQFCLIYFSAGNFVTSRAYLKKLSKLAQETHYNIFENNTRRMVCLLNSIEEEHYEDLRAYIEQENRNAQVQQVFKVIAACGLGDFDTAKREILELIKLDTVELVVLGLTAIILANTGYPVEGLEILAFTLNQAKGLVGWMQNWPLVIRLLEQLRSDLGQDVYQSTWERGKAFDMPTVVEKLKLL